MAVPRFRPHVLLEARERAGLTQLELAKLAEQASRASKESPQHTTAEETTRRVRTWESRIGAWERGVDSPSAPYIPTLARLVGVQPLELYDLDLGAPSFTALRFAAGMTLQALAEVTGISYTSLHRMLRGVTELSPATVARLSSALGASPQEIVASVKRDR